MRCLFPVCLIVNLCLVSACGSGSQRAEVSGTVSLNGVPIEEGSIQFIPVEGTTGPSTGGVIKDGKYRIPRENGAVIGKNRVELRAFGMSGKKIQDPTAPPGVLTDQRVQVFPPEYSDASTVIKEIHSGSNVINFEVRTDGK